MQQLSTMNIIQLVGVKVGLEKMVKGRGGKKAVIYTLHMRPIFNCGSFDKQKKKNLVEI